MLPAVPVMAATLPALATPPGLSFAEIKVTGSEFIVLQNDSATPIADLSSYWLEDFNNVNPLAAGTSNSSQQLPVAALDPGQTLLLSDDAMPTCSAAVAGKLSVSLTDSGGFLELVKMGQNSLGTVTETPGDVVSWSSTNKGYIQNLPTNAKDPQNVYYRYLKADSYAWQMADLDSAHSCQLNVVVAGGQSSQTIAVTPLAMAASSPPATILSLAVGPNSGGPAKPSLPAGDIGLLAPQLSELLPNAAGTGTDSTNEFIELYNPNPRPFELGGFTLTTGLTRLHKYLFPAGTVLQPKAFKAFYSAATHLSLSNTSGQAKLLDPFGTVIGHSDRYGTAKDGLAWALAKGKWYWTNQPTPGKPNVIKQAAVASAAGGKSGSANAGPVAAGSSATNGTGSTAGASNAALTTPIHPWTLAAVAVAALLYGIYEYRHDLANQGHKLRGYLAARRRRRQAGAGG